MHVAGEHIVENVCEGRLLENIFAFCLRQRKVPATNNHFLLHIFIQM